MRMKHPFIIGSVYENDFNKARYSHSFMNILIA
jgi:hypothetical protein